MKHLLKFKECDDLPNDTIIMMPEKLSNTLFMLTALGFEKEAAQILLDNKAKWIRIENIGVSDETTTK